MGELSYHPVLQWIRTLMLGAVAFMLAAWLGYAIAIWQHPAFDGVHKFMPIGQMFIGLCSGIAACIVAMFLDYRWQTGKRRAEIAAITAPPVARTVRR
jgi:hypothetical protein